MVNAIEEVFNDLGWSDGFRIPIANEENKRLEEEIEHKTRKRAALKSQLETTVERIEDIRKHASDIRQEQSQNQRLLAAHSAQVETENQLYRQAQADESRLAQQIRQYERQARDSAEKIVTLQQNVSRMSKKLDVAKKNIQLDKDRLLEWEERLNKKEERNMVIEQLVRSDEKTFKKIELERQGLSEKAELYRQSVIKAVGDVHELELTLDRTARLYSQAVKDRRQLMNQWSQSVHVLSQRDKSIYDALQEISLLREIAKGRMDACQEAERFLAIQETENKELEHGTKQLEKELALRKEERLKLTGTIDAYSIQVHVQKKQLQDLARRAQDTRANLRRKRAQVEEKRSRLPDCKRRLEDLKETLQRIEGQKMSIDERTAQLQDMLEKEEKRTARIAKEIKRQQTLIVRATTRTNELEGERQLLLLRQQTEAKSWEQLLAEQAREERSLRGKKDGLYRADVELQKSETRLQNVLGQERDKDELESKQERLKQLQRTLKEKSERVKSMQAQLAQVENEMRRMRSSMASNSEELQRLRSKQQELLALIEGGEKQLKQARSDYEERRVEESMLELRSKQANKAVLKLDDRLYDLDKYSIQMEAATQERRSEIKVQKESLNLQRRLVLTDCEELRKAIAERSSRIRQLQARYDIHVAALASNPEDGAPSTAAYLVIQSAQERYLLQERGDRLDRTIRKAEQEIRSMENSLRLVNVCNDKYKSSLSLVDEDGPEKSEQRRLDEELYEALDSLSQRRQALERAQEDCKRMEDNCEQLEKDIERGKEEKEGKRQAVSNLEQQITDQREKISRADKNLRKLLKDIQNKCLCAAEDATILLQERDVALRELRDQNTLALQRIAEFTVRHLEAEAYVKKLLAERNIDLPCTHYLRQQATPTSSSRCDSESVSSTCTAKTSSRTQQQQQACTPAREALVLAASVLLQFDRGFESPKSSKSTVFSNRRILKKK